jgi:hypothetical protein
MPKTPPKIIFGTATIASIFDNDPEDVKAVFELLKQHNIDSLDTAFRYVSTYHHIEGKNTRLNIDPSNAVRKFSGRKKREKTS